MEVYVESFQRGQEGKKGIVDLGIDGTRFLNNNGVLRSTLRIPPGKNLSGVETRIMWDAGLVNIQLIFDDNSKSGWATSAELTSFDSRTSISIGGGKKTTGLWIKELRESIIDVSVVYETLGNDTRRDRSRSPGFVVDSRKQGHSLAEQRLMDLVTLDVADGW